MTLEETTTAQNAQRRQQILEGALKVFSTKGFYKATNKDIAAASGGISPGLIYWYFKDKEDLFVSLLRERVSLLDLVDHSERMMALPPREALGLLGRSYLEVFRTPQHVALFRIIFGEISRFPQIGEIFYKLVVSRIFRLITNYLQHQIDLGTLRPHDTNVAARAFVGMFITQVLARELLRQPEAIAVSDAEILETVIEIFIRGLEPVPQT